MPLLKNEYTYTEEQPEKPLGRFHQIFLEEWKPPEIQKNISVGYSDSVSGQLPPEIFENIHDKKHVRFFLINLDEISKEFMGEFLNKSQK